MPSRSKRPRWQRLVLALGLCVPLLAATEVALRFAIPPVRHGYPPGMFEADDAQGFVLAADFEGVMAVAGRERDVRTNALGFRDEPLAPPTPGERRVLVLGDSLTFGHGVAAEETFPELLEELLAGSGRPAQVLNAGVPAYATYNQLAQLERWLPELRPDAVVLAFYVGNDIGGNHVQRFGRLTAESGGLVRASRREPPWTTRAAAWALVHLRTAQLLRGGLASLRSADPTAAREARCARAQWDPTFQLAVLRRVPDPVAEQAFAETTRLLNELAALCRSAGVPLVLALLPGPYQYAEGTLDRALELCALPPADFEPNHPNRELGRWARGAGVSVVDLLPVFRAALAARPGERLNLDVHLSEAGHRVVAEALVEVLRG